MPRAFHRRSTPTAAHSHSRPSASRATPPGRTRGWRRPGPTPSSTSDLFGFFGPYGPKVFAWSYLWGSAFPSDMNITGLPPSKSGTYHFGVLFEWNFGLDLFPVLVVDSTTAGVYDTAYLDLSFDWWLNGFSPNPVPDFSFADEPT